MKRDENIDVLQSEEYAFPYHYLPSLKSFPNFAKSWSFSPSYLACVLIALDWFKTISPKDGHRHIDFGCGDGGFLNLIETCNVNQNFNFLGIDTDDRAIYWAKNFSRNPNDFLCSNIGALETNSADSGTLIEVLEHIPPSECAKFIQNISDVMKPNGKLLVTVPSTEKPISEKHYRHFNFQTLTDEFAPNFDILEIAGFEQIDTPSKIIMKLMNNRFIYFETSPFNQYILKALAKKYHDLKKCGRIVAIFENKKN